MYVGMTGLQQGLLVKIVVVLGLKFESSGSTRAPKYQARSVSKFIMTEDLRLVRFSGSLHYSLDRNGAD